MDRSEIEPGARNTPEGTTLAVEFFELFSSLTAPADPWKEDAEPLFTGGLPSAGDERDSERAAGLVDLVSQPVPDPVLWGEDSGKQAAGSGGTGERLSEALAVDRVDPAGSAKSPGGRGGTDEVLAASVAPRVEYGAIREAGQVIRAEQHSNPRDPLGPAGSPRSAVGEDWLEVAEPQGERGMSSLDPLRGEPDSPASEGLLQARFLQAQERTPLDADQADGDAPSPALARGPSPEPATPEELESEALASQPPIQLEDGVDSSALATRGHSSDSAAGSSSDPSDTATGSFLSEAPRGPAPATGLEGALAKVRASRAGSSSLEFDPTIEGIDSSSSLSTRQSVISQIRFSLRHGVEEARIQLNPAELGHLDLQVQRREGRLIVVLKVERMETLAEIEAHLPDLHEALAERGLEFDEVRVQADTHSDLMSRSERRQSGSFGREPDPDRQEQPPPEQAAASSSSTPSASASPRSALGTTLDTLA
ncbi:MAG: flagellar hook-length control protein FliK [Planctomycetes bacterium]|nr:flagellar hook-length control protein FliK [Planctomycetota bacterium]